MVTGLKHKVDYSDYARIPPAAQVSERGIEGPPTLVVEVLSPTTREYDRTVKARRYAALGVRHYWVGDPEGSRLECSRAQAAEYARVAQREGDQTLTHPDWPDLSLTLADLWR